MSGPSVIRKLWIFVGTIVFPVGVDRFPDMSVDNRAGIIRHYPALSGIIRHYPALSGIIRHYPALSGIIRHYPALSGRFSAKHYAKPIYLRNHKM